jgi:hypothetical protein
VKLSVQIVNIIAVITNNYEFGYSLPLKLGPEVVKVPSSALSQFTLWVVSEAVKVDQFLGSGQIQQGLVDIYILIELTFVHPEE